MTTVEKINLESDTRQKPLGGDTRLNLRRRHTPMKNNLKATHAMKT